MPETGVVSSISHFINYYASYIPNMAVKLKNQYYSTAYYYSAAITLAHKTGKCNKYLTELDRFFRLIKTVPSQIIRLAL